MTMLWWLIVGHFVADYTLQSDFVAKFKSRSESLPAVPWYYVLASHAMTHSAVVGLITQSVLMSIMEGAAHFFIDWAKCEKLTNIHVDQALHIACKLVWVGVLCFTQ